jgi:hypothetical protein
MVGDKYIDDFGGESRRKYNKNGEAISLTVRRGP